MSFVINTSVSPTQGFSAPYNWESYTWIPGTYMGGPVVLNRLPSGNYLVSINNSQASTNLNPDGLWSIVADFSVIPSFDYTQFKSVQNFGTYMEFSSTTIPTLTSFRFNVRQGLLEIYNTYEGLYNQLKLSLNMLLEKQ